jgi:hypothetical protein
MSSSKGVSDEKKRSVVMGMSWSAIMERSAPPVPSSSSPSHSSHGIPPSDNLKPSMEEVTPLKDSKHGFKHAEKRKKWGEIALSAPLEDRERSLGRIFIRKEDAAKYWQRGRTKRLRDSIQRHKFALKRKNRSLLISKAAISKNTELD